MNSKLRIPLCWKVVLGNAETPSPLRDHFVVEDPRLKIYRREGERVLIPAAHFGDHPVAPLRPVVGGGRWNAARGPREPTPTRAPLGAAAAAQTLEELQVGIVTVDRRYDIRLINTAAREMLGVHGSAVGEDLVHLARGLRSDDLRRLIDGATVGTRTSAVLPVEAGDDADGARRWLRVSAARFSGDGPEPSVNVTLEDVSEIEAQRLDSQRLATEAQSRIGALEAQLKLRARSIAELTVANQELHASNATLRSTNDELLLANEEIQAATEEVETLNEELQATNEELETLNEEFQATIEELNTTNDDLEARSTELGEIAVRLEAEREAAELQRARLAAILETIPDAVAVLDEGGRPILENEAYQILRAEPDAERYQREAAGGEPETYSPQERASRGEEFRDVATRQAADGKRHWYEIVARRIRSDTQPGTLLVLRDITDRSLRRIQDEFMGTASHEMRTPLAVVIGYLHLLERNLAGADAEHAQRALRHASELDALVASLLDVTRLETGNLAISVEPLDLRDVVRACVDAESVLVDRQRIVYEPPERPVLVDGDEVRLRQVLRNLVDNARLHAASSPEVRIAVRRHAGRAELTVSDDGPGVPPEELELMFERFRRGARATSVGLGLGLHIAREILRLHGGTLTAASAPGAGLTFTIALPLLRDRPPRRPRDGRARAAVRGTRPTDDQPAE